MAAIYDLAHAQGFQPHHVYERQRARQVDGVGAKLDLVVVDAEAIVS